MDTCNCRFCIVVFTRTMHIFKYTKMILTQLDSLFYSLYSSRKVVSLTDAFFAYAIQTGMFIIYCLHGQKVQKVRLTNNIKTPVDEAES